MAAHAGYNKNSSAVKRIMQEARELANDPCTDYAAAPLEDDIFEWHCTLRGSPGTEFEGGLYHFRILLPSEYPFRPPAIMMLTPSGRFELNTKICISFTNYHEELWQPAWGVRTAIIGLQGFFPLKGTAAAGVGALEYPTAERKRLAALSRDWTCPHCSKPNIECLPDPPDTQTPPAEATASNTNGPEPAGETGGASLPSAELPESDLRSVTSEQPPPTRQIPLLAPTPTRPIVPITLIAPPTPPLPVAGPSTPVNVSPGPEGPPNDITDAPSSNPVAQDRPPLILRRSTPRPPIILDTAICVLLVLVFALVCRRIL